MPYLFDSYDQAGEMLNGTLGSEMVKGMETAGIQCLAWSLNGFYQISTFYNQPLRQEVPQNFKVVSSNSGRNIEALNAIGFSAVPLKIEGNWLNVSQYQFDGYDNIPLDTYYNGWDLRQRYLFITNHILSTGMYAVSSRFWDTLPKEHKDLVSKAAKAAAEYEIELYKTEEKDVFEFIKGKGIIIARPDLTHFKNAASLKYKDWIENGSELKRIFELYMKEKESI